MDDTLTLASNFVIHPFVGLVPFPFEFVLSEDEVDRIITLPLESFHPDNTAVRGRVFEYDGLPYKGPTFTYKGETIWGATAKIMDNLVRAVVDKMPLRPGSK